MIIDVTNKKTIYFSVSLVGVDINNIEGLFKIYLQDSLILGFSTDVENGKLRVKIPPIQEIVNFDFDEDQEYRSELAVVAKQDSYSVPWNGIVKIKKDISIETSIFKETNEDVTILVNRPIIK